MFGFEFYVDTTRCIGCQACVKACEECETHRGASMINFDQIDRPNTIATAAFVCFHCDDPTCAEVCPADAIKQGEDGIVQSALKPRCIACSNCVLACPFGIPKVFPHLEQMMKCDMCYDRTSIGRRPMCATVCPSQALAYVRPEDMAALRREKPVNTFWFGNERVTTKVFMMAPPESAAIAMDVVDYHVGRRAGMNRQPEGREPLWREEFSVRKADERYVSRRQMTKFLTLTSLGMFIGNLWILAKSWIRRDVSYPARAVARAWARFLWEASNCSNIRGRRTSACWCVRARTLTSLTARNVLIYPARCTIRATKNRIECPCHEGYFSIRDGSVLQGPPTRPLPRVVLERNGPELIAIRMEDRPEA